MGDFELVTDNLVLGYTFGGLVSITELPTRQGTPWSPEEDAALRTAFAQGNSIAETAARHQRTSGAIRSRLVKLELITSNGEPLEVRATQINATESAWFGEELARLRLSPRLAAALANLDVRTIDDFALVTSQQLLQVPGIRRRTLRELACSSVAIPYHPCSHNMLLVHHKLWSPGATKYPGARPRYQKAKVTGSAP